MGLFGKKKAPAPPAPRPAAAVPAPSMQEVIFKMRYSSKTIGRQATRSEKQIAVEERKAKEALAKGNIDGARIYAENAIRNRSESLGYLKLQSQLEAVAAKLHSQNIRAQVSDNMGAVTTNLSEALNTMDVTQISLTMEKFIQQSEDLDLQTKLMDDSIGESTASSTPQGQVDSLLKRIADENHLEIESKLQPAHTGAVGNQFGVPGSALGQKLDNTSPYQ